MANENFIKATEYQIETLRKGPRTKKSIKALESLTRHLVELKKASKGSKSLKINKNTG